MFGDGYDVVDGVAIAWADDVTRLDQVSDRRLAVEVVSSPEQWIGITNPGDLELAQAALAGRS